MAASGIAEHNEARRKQIRADRLAYLQTDYLKEALANNENNYCTRTKDDNSYDLQVEHYRRLGSPPDEPAGHDPQSIDKKRREAARQQQLYEYSAKLKNRYSSKDYVSQW